jgi:PqqD family protein of HPr-rel-A system
MAPNPRFGGAFVSVPDGTSLAEKPPEAIMEIQTVQLRDLALSDSGFVFDPMTGHSFTVNATGLCVLQGLKQGLNPEKIVQRLADTFDLEKGEDSARDVQDFLMQLRECGLIR